MNKSNLKEITISFIFCISLSKVVFCQKGVFKIQTKCGFEITLPSEFVKSKKTIYYSNTSCFDTILTNNKGFDISISGIDYPGKKYKDTASQFVMHELKGYEETTKEQYFTQSKEVLKVNDNEIGVLTYYKKSDVKKKNKVYYLLIAFHTNRGVRCFIHIQMQSTDLYKEISNNIIKSIKFISPI